MNKGVDSDKTVGFGHPVMVVILVLLVYRYQKFGIRTKVWDSDKNCGFGHQVMVVMLVLLLYRYKSLCAQTDK